MQTGTQEAISGYSKLDKMLTGLVCIMFPVGLYIMLSRFGRPYLWTTTVFLALQAVVLMLTLRHLANIKTVILSALLIFVLSFIIEYAGVRSSIPFGNYTYSGILYPLIGGVPIAISFAWFAVTASSLMITKAFLGNANIFMIAFVSSVLILATDILLEPFASFANGFWLWINGTVPIQNFLSWFVIGFIFSFIMEKVLRWDKDKITDKKLFVIPLIIISVNIVNFSIINILSGYVLYTIVGISLFSAELFFLTTYQKIEA